MRSRRGQNYKSREETHEQGAIPIHHPPPIHGLFLAVAYRGWQNLSGEAWEQLEPSMRSLTAVELPASCNENPFPSGLPRIILD